MPTRSDNVLTWASDLDPKALDQAHRTADLPFVAGHLALMPDAHWGMGATIGSVIPTVGAIVPAAVGVDIGCGMIAVETTLAAEDLPDSLDALHTRISAAVPAGVGKGHNHEADIGMFIAANDTVTKDGLGERAAKQMGTLGSGNHFIEVCLDETDTVWVVLHSGSRGVGNRLAMRHIERAKGIMKRSFIDLPDPDLAYLVEGTPEFGAYITDLMWAQEYASRNRETMIDAVLDTMRVRSEFPAFTELRRIDCHHNYTAKEHHHGRDMWITRKGAIRARVGDYGVIPGSMGTDSFIVEGLGNAAAYDSAPHGAGRRMSRGKARKTLDVETFEASMGGKTWQRGAAGKLLDEDPRAYKDIHTVMRDSADLARPVRHLRQVLNYKGM